MSKVIFVWAALLVVVGLVGAPFATAGEAGHAPGDMSQIVAFDNENFLGDHTHIFGDMKDLGKWGNSISSMIILSGTWEFFDDEDFKGTSMGTLGPGMYANVTDKGLKNNSISSVRLAKPAGASAR
jgi:Beta/Gamma crystallin